MYMLAIHEALNHVFPVVFKPRKESTIPKSLRTTPLETEGINELTKSKPHPTPKN